PVTLMPETLWHLAAVVPSLRPQDLLDDADEEGQASYRSSPDCGGGSATDHHTCPITVEGLDAVVCARDPSPSRTGGVCPTGPPRGGGPPALAQPTMPRHGWPATPHPSPVPARCLGALRARSRHRTGALQPPRGGTAAGRWTRPARGHCRG